MAKIRRTPYAFFYLEDDYVFDVGSLFDGETPPPAAKARVLALAMLTGERHQLGRQEVEALLSVPAERWVEDDGRDGETRRGLIEKGLLLSDAEDEMLRRLRDDDERLSACEWNLYAALYHFMTKWSGVDMRAGEETDAGLADTTRASIEDCLIRHGPPPEAFPAERSETKLRLPGIDRDGSLYRTLLARRTTRAFDTTKPMTLEQLDTVLRYVFGCHGYAQVVPGVVWIKRTSPSGGALHPIEAYPIVSNVEGVEPGIYQYSARDHSLVLVSPLDRDEAQRTATSFMAGQSYFGAAPVSFVLTARFARTHWKYRRHHKAYAGILMDAAHLSQTLYLVSGELGLGAFVTIAINARDMEERLGLDGVNEGAIAMTGCGPRAPGDSPLELQVSPAPPA